jgi:uncharacterized SAM-binding protein YcdF (DUF218 family)
MSTRPRSRYWFVFFVLLLLAAVTILCVRRVGRWLVVQDPLEPGAAIVVLSGRMPERALQAAELYRQRMASQVWLTHPVGPGEELAQMGIPFVSEETYNERILAHFGVPPGAIHILDPTVVNPADEIDAIGRQATRDASSKVLIVTSKAHSRRVRAIWHKKIDGSPQAIVRYTSSDQFDAEHWWRHTRDAPRRTSRSLRSGRCVGRLSGEAGILNRFETFAVRHVSKPFDIWFGISHMF